MKHTGYGNAAGLLASRGLLCGQGSRLLSSDGPYSSDSDSDTEEYRQVKDRINPVTGRVESEQPDPMEGMTEEEKEEEAKRLIVLFNKLARSVITLMLSIPYYQYLRRLEHGADIRGRTGLMQGFLNKSS